MSSKTRRLLSGDKRALWGERNILQLDLGDDDTDVHLSKSSLSFIHLKIYKKKVFKKLVSELIT